MEKSHYECKTTFHHHTQHGGGVECHSAIIQTFEWWYRVIQHKENDKELAQLQEPSRAAAEALKDSRRQLQLSSFSQEKHALWRAKYQQDKSRWVPAIPMLNDEHGAQQNDTLPSVTNDEDDNEPHIVPTIPDSESQENHGPT